MTVWINTGDTVINIQFSLIQNYINYMYNRKIGGFKIDRLECTNERFNHLGLLETSLIKQNHLSPSAYFILKTGYGEDWLFP